MQTTKLKTAGPIRHGTLVIQRILHNMNMKKDGVKETSHIHNTSYALVY